MGNGVPLWDSTKPTSVPLPILKSQVSAERPGGSLQKEGPSEGFNRGEGKVRRVERRRVEESCDYRDERGEGVPYPTQEGHQRHGRGEDFIGFLTLCLND